MDKYERFEAWLRENGAQFALVSRKVNEKGVRNNNGNNSFTDRCHYLFDHVRVVGDERI